jgi:hypothetical protein
MLLSYKDAVTSRNRIESLYSRLMSERSSFDAHWRELADYFVPRRVRINNASDRNRGDKRNQNIINNTVRFAARTLQSGMHAGLTSPARPWMRLTLPDQDMASFGSVRIWLQTVTQRMLTMFGVSNLYNTLPTVYGDMGVFGTAAMAVLEDTQDVFRCVAFPVGSYVLGHDERGMVAIFGREYQLTVLQLVREFALREDNSIDWSVLSPRIQNLWERSEYDQAVDVQWLVLPNEDFDPKKLESKFKRFKSCYWEKGSTQPVFLRESGFDTFPILAPRWDVTGEDSYGTDCPGMTALGDAKQLQMMEKKFGTALAKLVDPPMVAPVALRTQKTSLMPGDITYADVREGLTGLRPAHEVNIDLNHLGQNIQAVEYRIKRAFFEDLFLMLATTDPYRGTVPPTAREIDERHEEKLLALGPVLERTNDELLDPLVDRVFNLMLKAGLIPEPPSEIQGTALRPEYISILSQAQKLVGVVAQDRFLGTIVPSLEAFPEMRAKVKSEVLVSNYAEMLGVDPRAIRSDEEAAQIVQQQAQAAQDAQQAMQAKDLAGAMKQASETEMGRDSALDRIVGNMAQV